MFAMQWEKIYERGEQLNEYPYTEVVAFLHQYKKSNGGLNMLDVGSGPGDHAALFASQGFYVDAFDASQTAIDFAKDKYGEYENLKFFCNMTDDFVGTINYDLVLDRLCTSQTGFKSTKSFYSRLTQSLNSGASIFWQGFCSDNSGKSFALNHNLDEGYWDEFSGGQFAGLGCTTFFTIKDVEAIFKDYDLVDIREIANINHCTNYKANYWQIQAIYR